MEYEKVSAHEGRLPVVSSLVEVGDVCYLKGCRKTVVLRHLDRDMCQREWDAFCAAEERREMLGIPPATVEEVIEDDRPTMEECVRDSVPPGLIDPSSPPPAGFGLFLD